MERTFRGISVVGERILYRDADHALLGARASVKTPAALRRDVSAGRLVLDEADLELMDHRGAAKGLFLVIVGEAFVMVVPVPICTVSAIITPSVQGMSTPSTIHWCMILWRRISLRMCSWARSLAPSTTSLFSTT